MGDNEHQPLTPRQEAFCREYLIDLNGKQSAIRAGYSETSAAESACENLKKPNVLARINELMMERAERTHVTPDYVLSGITQIIHRCMREAPVRDSRGNIIPGEWQFDSKSALKGLELLGRHLILFTDKKQIVGDAGAPVEVKHTLSPETIAAVRARVKDEC